MVTALTVKILGSIKVIRELKLASVYKPEINKFLLHYSMCVTSGSVMATVAFPSKLLVIGICEYSLLEWPI